MRFDIVTLFPEMIVAAAGYGVTGKAIERDIVQLHTWNPRDYTVDKHRTVDDRPYGGGPGMVLKYQPLQDTVQAVQDAESERAKVVYLSPQGKPIEQTQLLQNSLQQRLILLAGRYEGIDERFIDAEVDEEWSLGDFIISGGEVAALIVVDAITRLLPGVLGDDDSAQQDSFMNGLLDYPHYTRPVLIDDRRVPDVLLSGNHAQIERWRMKQSLGRTWQRRPDLLNKSNLSFDQECLLEEFKIELDM